MLTIIQQLCSVKQKHTKYTQINTNNLHTVKWAQCDKTQSREQRIYCCILMQCSGGIHCSALILWESEKNTRTLDWPRQDILQVHSSTVVITIVILIAISIYLWLMFTFGLNCVFVVSINVLLAVKLMLTADQQTNNYLIKTHEVVSLPGRGDEYTETQ